MDSFIENLFKDTVGNFTLDIKLIAKLIDFAKNSVESDLQIKILMENLVEVAQGRDVLNEDDFDAIIANVLNIKDEESVEKIDEYKVFDKKSSLLIGNAIRLIAAEPVATERMALLRAYADEHGVDYQQLYNPIVNLMGSDYFETNEIHENKTLKLLKAVNKNFNK